MNQTPPLSEQLATRQPTEVWLKLFEEHPSYFEEAIVLAKTDQADVAWRATWLLGKSMKKNDPRLTAHNADFIQALAGKKDGHQRELLKVLEKLPLDEEQEGYLFDQCMTIWETVNKSPSVRSFAMKFIFKVCQKHPELKSEIEFLLQDEYLESLSAGIRKSIEKQRGIYFTS